MDIVKTLSAEARVALINFGGSRQGQRVPQGTCDLVIGELRAARLVTEAGNLTSRGGMVRDRVLNDVLDAL